MSFEKHLVTVLQRLGYSKRQRLTYQLDGDDQEIQHFLYFIHQPERKILAAHFGFRNLEAEQFSVSAFRKISRNDFLLSILSRKYNCTMQYSFGRFYAMENPGYWSLLDGWAEKLTEDLSANLLPLVKQMQSVRQLFDVLSSDLEPCPWLANNAAIRIAQVVFLGRQGDNNSNGIERLIALKGREITRDLAAERVSMSANEYVNQLMNM